MINFKPLPAIERLQELFIIDATSPSGLRNRVSRGRTKAGRISGYLTQDGYWMTSVDKIRFRAHRLVYALSHGIDPGPLEVDHINRTRDSNTAENLRATDKSGNQHNSAPPKNNKTGVKGVYFHVRNNRFIACITIQKVIHSLGSFKTIEEAAAARHDAEVRFGLRTDDSI